jgi:hypothetical protein
VTLRITHGLALNVQSHPSKGFDAFAFNAQTNAYVLCDGANSCPNSGHAARWLCNTSAKWDGQEIQLALFATHQAMLEAFPDTASTILHVCADKNGLHLASLGDSFLHVFQRTWFGLGSWKCVHTMPRDLDAHGHPSQLVGSEVCHTLHRCSLPAQGTYCVAMLSDGPGLMMPPEWIAQRLTTLGSKLPSKFDLDYLCDSMAHHALEQGCLDDTSVALIWLQYR